MAERLGTFVKKTLQAELLTAYEKVRIIRAQQQRRQARKFELEQKALPTLRLEMASLAAALNAALVQRANGGPDNVAAARLSQAALGERIADAEAEIEALGDAYRNRNEEAEAAEQAARVARAQLVKSIVADIHASLAGDSRLREQLEVLYAMRHLGSDLRIGYMYESDEAYSWPEALADAVGVNPSTEQQREHVLAKYAALLPCLT